MVKRLIIAAVGVVGLVVIGLGVASATVWRADDVLVAESSGGPHTLVTAPGVLELGGDPVTVSVTVPDDGQVTLAIGRDTDVEGWVGTEAHGQVTGLTTWHELAVVDVEDTTPAPSPDATDPAAAAPAPTPTPSSDPAADEVTAVDPAGSDLWVAEATGKGSASLEWPQQAGRWSLIAVSTGASAPNLTLAWPREVATPLLWPAVVVGLALLLLAIWLFLRDVHRHRKGLVEQWHPVTTGAVPTVLAQDVDAIPVLTRRQLREAAAARGQRPPPRTGEVAQVPSPLEDAQVRPAAAPVASLPLSRRALREGSTQTSPTGVVPAAPSSAGAAPVAPAGASWTPSSPAATAGSSSTDASANRWGPAAPTEQDGPHGRPSWLNTSAADAAAAGAALRGGTTTPSSVQSAPLGGAAPQSGGAPAGGPVTPPHGPGSAPGQGPVPARPTSADVSAPGSTGYAPGSGSAAPRTGPPTTRTGPARPGPVSGPPGTGPGTAPGAAGRAPVTVSTPGISGHGTDPHTGRPAWLSTTSGGAPPDSTPAGSRADAWRRAWGLPSTEGESNATESDQTEKEDGR